MNVRLPTGYFKRVYQNQLKHYQGLLAKFDSEIATESNPSKKDALIKGRQETVNTINRVQTWIREA